MTKKFLATTAAIFFSAMCTIAYAVPAKPVWNTMMQPDGTTIQVRLVGDEFFHYYINSDGQTVAQNEEGYWAVMEAAQQSAQAQVRRAKANQGRMMNANKMRKAPAATSSMTKGLVILVNYKDKSFESSNTLQAFKDMMMDDNYSYNKTYPGSAHKYFVDQSNGTYNPQFDVYGPYTVSKNSSYYAGSEGTDYATTMIKEACQLADKDGVDFSQYDQDKDGKVDFVFVIYAGHGQADSDCKTCVWPHQYWLSEEEIECKCDGKTIDMYACASELDGDGDRAGIATFCHEFSHVLGLADVYDVCYGDNYNKNLTPGDYHLMDGGAYNGDGYCPPNYNAYDKFYVGWTTPAVLNAACNVTLPADGATYYQITSDGKAAAYTKTSNVYYLENRQKSGWDKAIPGSGMLVWRVKYNANIWEANEPNAGKNGDYSIQANTTGAVNYELIVADGKHSQGGDDGDPFPGSKKVTTYTPFTAYPITDIAETNKQITFKFMGGSSDPVAVTGVSVSPTTKTLKINETGTLTATIAPTDATDKSVTWSSSDNTIASVTAAGLVKGIKAGSATITVTTTDGNKKATCAITVSTDTIQTTDCDEYAYTFTKKCQTGENTLGDYSWNISLSAGEIQSVDATKGQQFGSGKNPAGQVSLTTSEVAECLVKTVVIEASIASNGDGKLSIYINGTQVGTQQTLTTTSTEYTFTNTAQLQGNLEIRLTNSTKAMYIQSISVNAGGGGGEEEKVYTVAEVKNAAGKGTIKDGDKIYVKGYITSIQLKPTNFWKYGSAIIWIADTEGTSQDFELYNCYGYMGDTLSMFDPYQASGSTTISVNSVTDKGDIMYSLNDFIEAYGAFKLYNSIYELNSGCYITKGGKKITADVENVVDTTRPTKFIKDGMLIIEYNGTRYSITGEIIR